MDAEEATVDTEELRLQPVIAPRTVTGVACGSATAYHGAMRAAAAVTVRFRPNEVLAGREPERGGPA